MILSLSCKKDKYDLIDDYSGIYKGTYTEYYCDSENAPAPKIRVIENSTMEIFRISNSTGIACKSNFFNYTYQTPTVLNDYQLQYNYYGGGRIVSEHSIYLRNDSLTFYFKGQVNGKGCLEKEYSLFEAIKQ